MSSPPAFSHLDEFGRAHMVDVSGKEVSLRVAEASCKVLMSERVRDGLESMPKGDAVAVARLAGVQAAKRTDELIPLAHPLGLDQVEVELRPVQEGVEIRSRVVVRARTGAEMEAMVACSVAALALYDMIKGVERTASISELRLETKSGGASGEYRREE